VTRPSEAGPTARALIALELLQSQPGITADRLAAGLGVTARAARRYVATLREAGIPISSVSGPAGGYRLGRGLRLPPLVFSADEALGLVMAVLDGHHDAGSQDTPVGKALGKILRSLPDSVAAQANAVRRAASPAPDHGAARPRPEMTVALVRACVDRRRVRLGYRSGAGNELSVEVDPWAVVVRHSRWYLLCRSVPADAVRAYRVDRVSSVLETGEGFVPPLDLDAVTALEEHLATGWEFAVEVVLAGPVDEVAPWVSRPMGRLEAVDPVTTRLVGTTSNPTSYAVQLAAVPVAFDVVSGPELREAVALLARRLRQATRT